MFVVLFLLYNCVLLYFIFKGCNISNLLMKFYNSFICEGLRKLNDENNEKSFFMFDFYKVFMIIFKYRGVLGMLFFYLFFCV